MEEIYTLTMVLSIVTFTLSSVMTPGPNNIMLITSGLTFGYKDTVPHILGIVLGFTVMVVLVGLGMGMVFQRFPWFLSLLKVVGMLYLCWMAYKIANNTSHYEIDEHKKSKPFSFLQAAAFQWVNPKAWIVSITAVSIFVTPKENALLQIFVIAFIYMLSGMLSCHVWALGGIVLKRFLKQEKVIRIVNISMAVLLVASVVPFVFE